MSNALPAVVLALALTATAALPAQAAEAPEPDLVEVRSLTSPLGTHTWYRQTFHGLKVVDGYYAVHELKDEDGEQVVDGRTEVPAGLDVSPGVKSSTAVTAASSHVSARTARAGTSGQPKNRRIVPSFGKGEAELAVYRGKLVWDVVASSSSGSTETFIDAETGAVNGSRVLSKNVSGTGLVFDPNPVQKLQDESLVDGNNADTETLTSALVNRPLAHLDGSNLLRGQFARIVQVEAGQSVAESGSNEFLFSRADGKFEQVNAYYGIDLAQTRLVALGFPHLGQVPLRINTTTEDQSFYSPVDGSLTFGTGGVDDAEDLDIVWHEFGHAIQDFYVFGFGTNQQSRAVGEGFGDYWAVSMSKPSGGGFQEPCVGDWDSVSYTPSASVHCLRRTDRNKFFPADLQGEEHADGEIWSRALWGISKTIGRGKTDSVALGGNLLSPPNVSMRGAAQCAVKAAGILYGSTVKATVKSKFAARGLSGGTCPTGG